MCYVMERRPSTLQPWQRPIGGQPFSFYWQLCQNDARVRLLTLSVDKLVFRNRILGSFFQELGII